MMETKRSHSVPSQRPNVLHVERPWGFFQQFVHNQAVTVSMMTVKSGKRLSLQSHTKRAELWLALDQGTIVQVGEEILYPGVGETIWIPAGVKHRLSSDGSDVRILEIAFGDWQQEDITRYEDDYRRPEQGE